MAYAAVISLKHTIPRLFEWWSSPYRENIYDYVHIRQEVESLQEVLERLDHSSMRNSRKRVDDLDRKIREAVYQLEDVLESHLSDQLLSQSEILGNEGCSLTIQEKVRQEIHSLVETVKKMKEEYIDELDNPSPEEEDDDDDDDVSSSIDFGGKKSDVFGLSQDEITEIKDKLTARKSYEFGVVSLVGLPGSGRSIFAMSVFEDIVISTSFDWRAWVTVGPKYQPREILVSLLSQLHTFGNDELLSEGDEKLAEHLYTSLKGIQYLIVLDDIREIQVWDFLRRLFPDENNGSRVLLTTSLEEVALFAKSFNICRLPVLNKEESWDLLRALVFDKERSRDLLRELVFHKKQKRKTVFVKESCPPELEKVGKKIAENCEGLLLEVAKIALFLSKAEKTQEQWNKVAQEKEIYVFKDAYDEFSEVSKIMKDLQLSNSSCNGDDDDVSSRIDSATKNLKALGLCDATDDIRDNLSLFDWRWEFKVISLTGMAGIGKTTLAKEIFEDPTILHHFDHRVWVTLGPKYQSEEILVDILAQIDPKIDQMRTEGDEILAKHFCSILSFKRSLIVLDDMWNIEPFNYLYSLFKDIKFEVLITTRLQEVAYNHPTDVYEMQLLNREESWCLLREKVFAEKLCPPELERAGKMIATNCEGLPLMIVSVATLLSEADKVPEYWSKVATKENSVFEHANDKIAKVIFSSYKYLPQHLKACFLYMAVFPQDYEIPTSKLFELWNFDRILIEPKSQGTLEDLAMKYLEELDYRNLLKVGKRDYVMGIKTCRLHSVFWHLSVREARRNKFFHVLNRHADGLKEDIKSQRRLCIQNNILFSIKDVYNSMASISTARSLLCTGPPHQYAVPICFNLRLLRVLDALTIRLYEFPIKVLLHLVHLRYLALTYDGKLPPSISKLRNLECLIVHRYLRIELYGFPSYLPMEIWDMQELVHLQVTGSNLQYPCGACLSNLKVLLDVSALSCTKSVLLATPYLEKLGIRIELTPDTSKPLFSFDHISHLDRLESLKCVVVNPQIRFDVVIPSPPISMIPSSLKRLSLSGFRYPWDYMRTIASLPNLEVLKLRCYAFQGPEWVMHEGEFISLRYLLLEDTDLVYWRADYGCYLQSLQQLIIRHCYKLKVIPLERLTLLRNVKLVDCNPAASEGIPDYELETIHAHFHSSWEDAN